MKNNENWLLRFVKNSFDIKGPIDEYKTSEINRICMNSFAILWIYLGVSTLLLYIALMKSPSFISLLLFANVAVIFLIGIYTKIALKRALVLELDSGSINPDIEKEHIFKESIINGICFGLLGTISNGIKSHHAILDYLLTQEVVIGFLIRSFLFSVLMVMVNRIKFYNQMKKIQKGSEKELSNF